MAAMAEDDYTLYYSTSSNPASAIAINNVSNIQKIVFKDGKMVTTMKDGSTTEQTASDVQRLWFSTPETVGIKTIKTEAAQEAIYDLSGRRVKASSLEALPKGTYIVNGKKVTK